MTMKDDGWTPCTGKAKAKGARKTRSKEKDKYVIPALEFRERFNDECGSGVQAQCPKCKRSFFFEEWDDETLVPCPKCIWDALS